MASKKDRVHFAKSILVPHFNVKRQPYGLPEAGPSMLENSRPWAL
jgi:hypothetical protein